MASNQSVQVTLGFQADTSNARKAIQDLNAQLNKLQSFSMDNLHVSNDIEAAAEAAKVLQQNLQGAMNFNTGQLNITQFAQNLKNAGTSVTELSQKLINAGTSGTQTFTALGRAIASMDVPLKQTNTLINNMMTTLKNTAKWELSSNLVHGLESAFSNAISYAKNLNSALNDIRIVSGASVEQMAKFAVEANAAAKSLGTTTRAYADAALIYYQQGDSAEMAAKKAEITLKATNAAFSANAQQMSEMLTATWNSYQAGADELEHMVDVMANLGAHTATSMEEIATSLQKVAATANTVGVSMEQMSAMISTVSSVTRQSAETIGTSMNTILSRIGGLKLGQTLEDGVDLNKYSKALASVGVQVLDTQGQLRNMGAVIDELGEKWNQLSTAQQSALAQTVGGTRQYTSLMALFSNWDKYKENFDLTQNSDGALQKMQDTYLESWEGASQQLKASLESIYQTLIDDEGMIKFTQSITDAVEQVQNLIQSFGGLPGILTQVGAIALQVFSKNIGQGIASSIASIKTFATSFKDLKLIGETIGTNGLNRKEKMQYYQKAIGLTTSERVSNQFMTKMWDEMGTAKSANEGNVGMQAQIDASQILIEKKLELQQIESSLSATEKANAQASIASLNAQTNQIEALSATYTQETHELEKIKDAMTSITQLSKAGQEKGITQNMSNPDEIRKAMSDEAITKMTKDATVNSALTGGGLFALDISKMKQAQSGVQGLIDHFEKLNRVSVQTETAAAKMSDALTRSVQDPAKYAPNLLKQLEITESRLKELGVNTTDISTAITNFKNAMKSGDDGAIQNSIATLRSVLDGLSQAANNGSHEAELLLQQLGYLPNQLDGVRDGATRSEEAVIGLSQAMQTFIATANKIQASALKIGTSLTDAIKAFASLSSAANSTYNLMSNWDSSNAIAKFSQMSMAALSTATAMKSMGSIGSKLGGTIGSLFGPGGAGIGSLAGGAIGAVLALGSTVFSGVKGSEESQQKAAQEALSNRIKSSQTRADDSTAELDNLQKLISTYNELYTKYEENHEVTKELTSAAQALADAYGITGSAVSIITGHFEDFNASIKESLDLTKEITQGQTDYKLASQNAMMAASQIKITESFGNNVQTQFEKQLPETLSSIFLSSSNLLDDNGAVDFFKNQANNVINNKSRDSATIIAAVIDGLWDAGLGEVLEKGTNPHRTKGYNNLIDQVDFDATYGWENRFGSTGTSRARELLESFDNDFGKTLDFLLNQVARPSLDAGELNSNAFTNLNLENLLATLGFEVQNFDNLNSIFEAFEDLGFDKNTLDGLKNNYGDLTAGDFRKLWNADKTQLVFNPRSIEDLFDTYDLYTEYLDLLNKLMANITDTDDPSYELLSKIKGQIESVVNNEQLKQSVEQAETLRSNLAQKTLAQTAIINTVGLNNNNSSLIDFYTVQDTLMTAIENNAKLFKELDEFGGQPEAKMDPQLAEKYREAKKNIANRLLKDYSDLDNFIAIANAIEQNYSDSEQQQIVKEFINAKEIKQINNAFLAYTKTLFNIYGNDNKNILTENADNIMAILNDSTTDINEVMSQYESLTKASSLLKSNMSLQDASEIYSLFQDNLEQWNQFIATKDMDARAEILKNVIEANKAAAQTKIDEAVGNAEKQYTIQNDAFLEAYGEKVGISSYDEAASKYQIYTKALSGYYSYRDANFTKTENGYMDNKTKDEFSNEEDIWNKYVNDNKLSPTLGSMNGLKNIQDYAAGFEAVAESKRNMDTVLQDQQIYQLFISSMDASTQAVGKLVSAFKSMPKTASEAKEILELLGKEFQYEEVDEETGTVTGIHTAKKAISPEELMNMSEEEYNDAIIEATRQKVEEIEDPFEKRAAQDQLYSMEKQQRDLKISDEKQHLSDLQSEYQKLSNIDITKMPKEGTQAYQALKAALDAVGISMEKFNKMSDLKKNEAFYKAQRKSLEEQRDVAQQMADVLYDKKFNNVDWDNLDQILNGETKENFINRYNQWQTQQQQVSNLNDQIMNSYNSEAQGRIKILQQETDAIDKRLKNNQEKANKMQTEAQVFTNAVQTGELTASQKVGLSEEDIAKWDSLATAEQRAEFAAKKWSEAIIAGKKAFEESQLNISNADKQLTTYESNTAFMAQYRDNIIKNDQDFIQTFGTNNTLLNAYQRAFNNAKIDDKSSVTQVISAVKEELKNMGDEGTAAYEQIEAAGLDAMSTVYKAIADQDTQAAQQAIQNWANAFQTIANLRKTLLEGGDIVSALFGTNDPSAFASALYSTGMSGKELREKAMRGELDANDFKYLSFDRKNFSAQYGLVEGLGSNANKKAGFTRSADNSKAAVSERAKGYLNIEDDKSIDSYITKWIENLASLVRYSGDVSELVKGYFNDEKTAVDEINRMVQVAYATMDEWEKGLNDYTTIEEALSSRKGLEEQLEKGIGVSDLSEQFGENGLYNSLSEAQQIQTDYKDFGNFVRGITQGSDVTALGSALKDHYTVDQFLSMINTSMGTEYKKLDEVTGLNWINVGAAADKISAVAGGDVSVIKTAIAELYQRIADQIKGIAPGEKAEEAQEAADQKQQEAEDAAASAGMSKENIKTNQIQAYSKQLGISDSEFVKLAQAFEDLDKNTKILKNNTEEYKEALYEAAAAAEQSRQGAEAIGKHYKSNKKDIEDLANATGELTDKQKSTMETMRDNLAQTFNTEKKYLTDDFIKKHIKDYQDLAKGSKEAADKISQDLKNSILNSIDNSKIKVPIDIDQDHVADAVSSLEDLINGFANEFADTPIGVNIDESGFIDAMNYLLATGQVTADQIQALFNSIGYHPNIETKYVDLESTHPIDGNIDYNNLPNDVTDVSKGTTNVKSTVTGQINARNGVPVPQINGVSKISSSTYKASHAASGGGGGGGGGGGSKKPKHKEHKGDEEVEHYHQVNRQIEYQERLLKRVNLLKQRRYGWNYLHALQAENEELMKHIDLVQRRASARVAGVYMQDAIQKMSRYDLTFDSTRQINYQRLRFSMLDDLNHGIDEYNAMVDAGVPQDEAEEIFQKKYQKPYDEATKAIAEYEKGFDYIQDAIEMTMEDLNKISANLKEMAVYKMKFQIELDERDLKRLDFIVKRYDEYVDKQAESFETLMNSADLVMKDLSYTDQAFAELFGWYNTKVRIFDDTEAWYKSMTDIDKELLEPTHRFLNQADYIEGLREVQDTIMENLEKLQEYRKQMLEVYGHTLELAADKLENFTNTLEHHITMYDGYLEVLELISDGHEHYLEDIQLLNGAYNSSLTEIAVIREHLNVLLDQREKLLTQMEDPIYASNEKIQKDFEALEERIEELEEQLLDATKTTLDKAKAMLDKAVESAVDKMSKLTNMQGTDVEWLSTQWDWWKEEQDQYVDRITQVYEVDKLVRDIEKSIADTRNKNNQAQLKALEDEIQLRSKNNALNEYSIEMMRLSYELLLAQQNLENANDSKDTVRLTRDDNGNYVYQYTADEDKIAEAQQKYNDVLYEMNQTTKERYRDLVQSGIDIRRKELEQFQKIMDDTELSAEEKMERMQQIYEHYGNMLEGIDIFMDEVLQNMGENQLAWTNNMNENLIETSGTSKEQLTNLSNAARTQLNSMYNDTRISAEEWKKGTQEQIEGVGKALKKYEDQLLEVQKTSDITLQNMLKQITEYGKQASTVSDQASILAKTMQDVLDKLVKMNEQWISMDQKLQAVIDHYLELHKIIDDNAKKAANENEGKWVTDPNPELDDAQIYNYEGQALGTGSGVGNKGGGSGWKWLKIEGMPPVPYSAGALADAKKKGITYYLAGDMDPLTGFLRGTVKQVDPKTGKSITSTITRTRAEPPDDSDGCGACSASCATGCGGECSESCKSACKNGCRENCSTWCGQHCASDCNDGCGSNCTTGCKGGCKNECSEGCAVGCQNFCTGSSYPEDPSKGSNGPATGPSTGKKIKAATGGLNTYTGIAWLDGTFQKPEYVLNAEQTHEMFSILNDHTIYRLIDTMTAATQAMLSSMGLHAGSISTQSLVNSTNAPMTTYITAEFPNATDHNEIELALQNLVNNTAQSINKFMN